MPVTKRFEVNRYLEDIEELHESGSLFSAQVEVKEASNKEEVRLPKKSFWRRWRMVLESKIYK